ncbi:hypothetical protein [Homoserinimonas sp. A520]
MPAPARDARFAALSYALFAITLFTCISLILMYGIELPGGGSRWFGPASDILSGLSNLLLPFLIAHVGANAATTPGTRAFNWVVIVLSPVAAISSFLLVTDVLSFEVATPITVAVILLQAIWLFWVSGHFLADTDYPRRLARFGQAIGIGLVAGVVFVGAAVLFPWLSWPQLTLGVIGLIPGLAAWLSWPFWYLWLGRWLQPSKVDAAVNVDRL